VLAVFGFFRSIVSPYSFFLISCFIFYYIVHPMPDLLSLLLLLHAFFLALWARLFLRIAAILEKNWYILAQTLDFLPAELYNRGTQPLAMARKAMYGGGGSNIL